MIMTVSEPQTVSHLSTPTVSNTAFFGY